MWGCFVGKVEAEKDVAAATGSAQDNGHRNFLASRKIQASFRGHKCRQYLKCIDKSATIIQKNFRGFLGRKQYRKLLETTLQNKLATYYNNMAMVIQKTYRGYMSRLRILDYYQLKSSIEAEKKKGQELKEHSKNLTKILTKNFIIYIANRLHYLMRTQAIPGVPSQRTTKTFSYLEELLAKLIGPKYQKYMNRTMRGDGGVFKFLEKDNLFKDVENSFVNIHKGRKLENPTLAADVVVKHPMEKYCGEIIDITKKFDIIKMTTKRTAGKDKTFQFNIQVVREPNKVDRFVEALRHYCESRELEHRAEKVEAASGVVLRTKSTGKLI